MRPPPACGRFATLTPVDSLIAVQMILAVVAIPLMLLSGLLGDRRQATESSPRVCDSKLLSSIAGSFLRLTDDAAASKLVDSSPSSSAPTASILQLGDGATESRPRTSCAAGSDAPDHRNIQAAIPAAMERAIDGETVVWTSADAIPGTASQDVRSFDELAFRFLVILPFAGSSVVRGALLLATTRERTWCPSRTSFNCA
jgi:hypothetical protein